MNLPSKSAIQVEGASKKFGLTLRQSMKYGLRDSLQILTGGASESKHLRPGEFWAVEDVSFHLCGGQALGIMGVNGSGKTTLLRMLNGIYLPDSGSVTMRGRIGAIIAAGAGFAPMLSGRENVYINGTLMGLTIRQIDDLMEEIVSFAELGHFIDLPVKNYSSGMYVRLGFAIAALSKPDILLMDEVLAVGDLNFQKKCFDYILNLKKMGTAIVLVSHSPGSIWSVCDRGLFMDRGRVIVNGAVEDVIRAYDDQNARNSLAASTQFDKAVAARDGVVVTEAAAEYGHSKGGTGDVVCSSIRLLNSMMAPANDEFQFMETIYIDSEIIVFEQQKDLLLRFTIDAMHYRYIATVDSHEQGLVLPSIEPGRYRLLVKIDKPNFRPGAYAVNVGILRRNLGVHLFYWFGAQRFLILHPQSSFLYADSSAVMHLQSEFTFEMLSDPGVPA